jgi:hypothetical protein
VAAEAFKRECILKISTLIKHPCRLQALVLQEQVATLHTRLNSVTAEADARVLAARAAARNAIAATGGASLLQGQVGACFVPACSSGSVSSDQHLVAPQRAVLLLYLEACVW